MRFATQLFTASVFLGAHAAALAHGGHGMTGGHWHATDAYGFVLVAVLAAFAIWLSRGK